MPEGDQDRTTAVPLPPFLVMHPPMFPHGNGDGYFRSAESHHAVGADVDPIGIGIRSDHRGAGTDKAAAVVAMPDRRGKRLEIDIRIDDVFQDRSIRYERGSEAAP